MVSSKSSLKAEEILGALTSGDGTLVMNALSEIEENIPSTSIGQLLNSSLPKISDTVQAFQVRKTIKIQSMKLTGRKPAVTLGELQNLLKQPDRFEEIAITISFLSSSEAILASDILRTARWNELPTPVLPTICQFLKKFGSSIDSPALIELCRHPDPTVLTTALSALEIVDPNDLPSLVTPLLTSPNTSIRAQAIQALYRWDKAAALRHLVTLLFSKNPGERVLALHHAISFPYLEIEPHLLRFLSECNDTRLLMRVSQIMQANAHIELPFKLYWLSRSLKQQHQNLIKGVLLGVIRALAETKKIKETAQDFHDQLKERVKKEEERLLRESLSASASQSEDKAQGSAFSLPEIQIEEKDLSTSQASLASGATLSFDDFEKSDLTSRLQILSRLSRDEFLKNKGKLVFNLKSAKPKEQAAIIKAIGRSGTSEDASLIKPFIDGENPETVCASIEALAHLDSDFLAIYLPQLMQNKHGKIRLQATRTFVGIDRLQIKSLIAGMLQSSSPRQRSMVIPATMLVDFSLVREPLIKAFEKELSPELIEKIGLVFAANPDRELLRAILAAEKNSSDSLKPTIKKTLKLVSEKLSIALGKISSPEDLIKGEEKALSAEPQNLSPENPLSAKSAEEKQPNQENQIKNLFSGNDEKTRQKRAKITKIVLILATIAWILMLATLIFIYIGN
ncbi:MAG: HEAT repeat domain-containing protein [Candidatus Riflebacteria bacterium]|nr:HEAT repeat domain-containing protein [Candidatus Riflebacteria bacterium]